jgi:hypothetical protein
LRRDFEAKYGIDEIEPECIPFSRKNIIKHSSIFTLEEKSDQILKLIMHAIDIREQEIYFNAYELKISPIPENSMRGIYNCTYTLGEFYLW